jgi:hypothetical protein
MQFSKLTQAFKLGREIAQIPVLHNFEISNDDLIFLTEYESVSKMPAVLKVQG